MRLRLFVSAVINVTKQKMMNRGIMFCPGLHPSQQLTRYDGEAGTQNGEARRLVSQGSGDSAEIVPSKSDSGADAALPSVGPVDIKAQIPALDLSDLYAKPFRPVDHHQDQARPISEQIASYRNGDPSLQDSGARKYSLSGD